MVEKKLRLRGRDYHGEIPLAIPCPGAGWMLKMVGWRPIWCQFGDQKKIEKKIQNSGQPSRAVCDRKNSKTCQNVSLFQFLCSKMVEKKVEIEGVGPIWRDPRRNSASNPASDVQNGWMATHLVPKRCDFGSLGVPGPASTPKPNLAFSNLH